MHSIILYFNTEDKKLLRICLPKALSGADRCWKSLLKGQYTVDPLTFDKMEQKLTLQRYQYEVRLLSQFCRANQASVSKLFSNSNQLSMKFKVLIKTKIRKYMYKDCFLLKTLRYFYPANKMRTSTRFIQASLCTIQGLFKDF